jgi:hypothetical protein
VGSSGRIVRRSATISPRTILRTRRTVEMKRERHKMAVAEAITAHQQTITEAQGITIGLVRIKAGP